MKFFHALIILATSGGVATAKDSSRASASDLNRKQERDRKRFLRIKQAESARRRTQTIAAPCVEGPAPLPENACCINNIRLPNLAGGTQRSGKGGKKGVIVRRVEVGDEATVGCAEVCRPLCAEENAEGPPDDATNYPPDTCIDPDPQGPPDAIAEWLAIKDVCPLP